MARVIKAQDLETPGAAKALVLNLRDLSEQARQIVLDARKQAAAIKAQARQDVKDFREQARQEGYAQGLSQGAQQGVRQAREQAVDQVCHEAAELAALVQKINQETADVREQLVHRMKLQTIELAMELAAKIVGKVAASDIEAARANLAKVLELASRNGEMLLKVNPHQLRRLQEHSEQLVQAMGLQGPVRLVGDEAISAGGVKLTSAGGEIDATIETQLANIAQGLLGNMGSLFEQPEGAYVGRGDALPQEAEGRPEACSA